MRKKFTKREHGSREYQFVDAKKPLTLHVSDEDIYGATPRSFKNCVLSRTVQREHKCFDIQCFRTVAYIRKRERSIPVRYAVTEAAKDLLVAFDASGRAHPITVTFVPPPNGRTRKYLNSPAVKKRRKASYERSKRRAQRTPQHRRRAYTRPDPLTLWGVRNGVGQRVG